MARRVTKDAGIKFLLGLNRDSATIGFCNLAKKINIGLDTAYYKMLYFESVGWIKVKRIKNRISERKKKFHSSQVDEITLTEKGKEICNCLRKIQESMLARL